MIGTKINEFEKSNTSVEAFNKLFPKTPLRGMGNVDIGGIVENKLFGKNSVFVRTIAVNGVNRSHDFGEGNFHNLEMFESEEAIRFKYIARDLEGNFLNSAFSMESLAKKLECQVNVIKRRLIKEVTYQSRTENLFNVTRREL